MYCIRFVFIGKVQTYYNFQYINLKTFTLRTLLDEMCVCVCVCGGGGGGVGGLLRREGEEPIISEKFYRMVVQAMLIFGSKTWVFMAAMLQNLDGVHVGFLRQVIGMKAQILGGDIWRKKGEDRVL